MQILLDHVGYVLATLLVGVVIGWRTAPMLARLRERAAERARRR